MESHKEDTKVSATYLILYRNHYLILISQVRTPTDIAENVSCNVQTKAALLSQESSPAVELTVNFTLVCDLNWLLEVSPHQHCCFT